MGSSVPNGDSAGGLPRRGRFQFSLRHLLALPVLVALFIGIPIVVDTPLPPPLVLAVGFGFVILISLSVIFGRRGRLLGVLIGAGIAWLLHCLLLPGVADPYWGWTPAMCRNNLSYIGVALHNYHDRYGCFPPPYIPDEKGRPMHSWRVLILPLLPSYTPGNPGDVYDQYRFNEPWDSPHNRRVTAIPSPVFQCPEEEGPNNQCTSYLAVVGPDTMWRPGQPVSLSQIADGTPNTLAVVEVQDSGIHWAEPRDLDVAQLALGVNSQEAPGVSSLHVGSNWFPRPVAANVLMLDGSTRFLRNDTSPQLLQAMATTSGGESIETDNAER